MMTNPLEELAPLPKLMDDVTAAALARHEAVLAFAQEVKANSLGRVVFNHPAGQSCDARHDYDAVIA